MKIYASRYEREIQKYVGKNVWILANSWRWIEYHYIKPIRYDHGDLYYCRVAKDLVMDHLLEDYDFQHLYKTPWEDITIAEPLDILTDEEMQGFLMHSRDEYFGGNV